MSLQVTSERLSAQQQERAERSARQRQLAEQRGDIALIRKHAEVKAAGDGVYCVEWAAGETILRLRPS